MTPIDPENLRQASLVGLLLAAVAVAATITLNPRPPGAGADGVTRRDTLCPPPELRAPVVLDDPAPAPEPPLDFGAKAGEPAVPARGADVTPIVGAALLDAPGLAREVNRIVGQLNPAVAVRSVSLSWRCGSQDATCVVAWERRDAE